MSNKIFEKLKVIELARFFMATYNYREVEIKNVEGVFIENRLANYPLIRISNKKYENLEDFNQDIEIMEKVLDQYETISSIDKPKCLNIFFAGTISNNHDNIYSIVIHDDEAIANNELLSKEFPLITSNFNLNQVDNIINMQNQNKTNLSTEKNQASTEKRVTDMFSLKEMNKKTKFTRTIVAIIFSINIYFSFFVGLDETSYIYDYSFYGVFFSQLGQFYRLFTSLVVDNNLFFTIIFAMFFYRFSSYVELKIGTKKIIILFVTGLIMIITTMFTIARGDVMLGSYPLLTLIAGAYVGAIFMPSERDFLKINLLTSGPSLGMMIVLGAINPTNLVVSIISFLTGAAMVYALNKKDEAINFKYITSIYLVAIFMIGTYFIPNQTLNRSHDFEQKYLEYVSYEDKARGKEYQDKIDKYYEGLGVTKYDE